jgi:ribonuclease VapC
MTLDSSVLVAIALGAHGHLDLVDRILSAAGVRVAAPTLVETSMVLASRRRTAAANEVRGLVQELGVTVVPFGEREWHAAVDAFFRFGRGRHKAALNFGDCLSYATAATANDSLLFIGDDFSHTDITPA